MPVGNSGNNSFASIAALPDGRGEDAAAKLGKLYKQLRNAGADAAAGRLTGIESKIADENYDFADLENYIEPDRTVDELNSARGRVRWRKIFHGDLLNGLLRPLLGIPKSVRYAHLLRNVTALAPLIFTWIMLGLAAQHYDHDLNTNPRAVSEPFLLLWQQGFGTHFRSFEQVTIIDFCLLGLVVLLTFWVHWAEGQADLTADSVYEAVGSLRTALARPFTTTPLTAGNWLRDASNYLSKSVQLTQDLNAVTTRAVQEASEQLTGIQDTGQKFLDGFQEKTQDYIRDFKDAVLETLVSVTEQNAEFIEATGKTNQEVLRALVEQQMAPLLTQMQGMLDQFNAQQVAYTAAVTDLTKGVGAIRSAATGLATSAQEFTGSTHSIAGSFEAMASSQERFTSKIEGSAQSMSTAAVAMTEVKDTLHQRLQEMTSNITSASASLSTTQVALASTTDTLNDSAKAFAKTMVSSAGALAESTDAWTAKLKETTDMLQQALSGAGLAERRRRLLFFRRS